MRLPWLGREQGSTHGLIVYGGRVSCPYQGDIDVERCVDCPRLDRVDDLGETWRIECNAPNPLGDLKGPWAIADRN